jgi:hypothetical protein
MMHAALSDRRFLDAGALAGRLRSSAFPAIGKLAVEIQLEQHRFSRTVITSQQRCWRCRA